MACIIVDEDTLSEVLKHLHFKLKETVKDSSDENKKARDKMAKTEKLQAMLESHQHIT